MGLLDRYHLHLKRPAKTLDAAFENLRETERWANVLPLPAPQMFALVGDSVTFAPTLRESFDFAIARPNTVVAVDLFIDCHEQTPGGGAAIFYGYIDGAPIDANNFCAMNEAAVRAGISTGYVTTIPQAGSHTLELWTERVINAGAFSYLGNLRLWVF